MAFEFKRKGVNLSFPQGLHSVLARILAEAPPAETRTRLDYRRAHQYLTEEGFPDPKEQARMVKLCMKRVRRLATRGASAPTSGTKGDDKINGKEPIAQEARASAPAMLPRAKAKVTMKDVDATVMIPTIGDMVYVNLDGYEQASEAIVVDEENGEINVMFMADDAEDRYPANHADIKRVIKGAPQGSDAKRQREEHKQAREELEETNATLSHRNGNWKGEPLCKPQPNLDVFPTPAACPSMYEYIVIECGSGTASLGFRIYQMGKFKVGVLTIDWDAERNAHLVKDIRELDFRSLLKMFPKLIHVHFTWDCKANSAAGIR